MVCAEMNQTQEILFGVTGQTFNWSCPEGRPSSVTTVSVFENATGDDGTAETATTGSASSDGVSTTITATVGVGQANPRKVNVTSTSSMAIGREYLLTNAAGEKEFIEIVELDTANSIIYARHPLRNVYVSTDTIQGTRITVAVNSTWVADSAKISHWLDPNPRYRIRWQYVVNSVTHVHASYVDLVRYRGENTVRGSDVDARFPGWIDKLGTYDQEDQGARLINEAYRQVKIDLYQQMKADQMARNGEVIDELVIAKAALIGAEAAAVVGGSSLEQVALLEKIYGGRLTSLISSTKIPFSVEQSGAGVKVPGLSIWRR